MLQINTLSEAISVYKKYQHLLRVIDDQFIEGTIFLTDSDLGHYVLAVEDFPAHQIRRKQIEMRDDIKNEFYNWKIAEQKRPKP